MPALNISSYTIAESLNPKDIPDFLVELVEKLRYNIRADGEMDELAQLRSEVKRLREDLQGARADREEWRMDAIKKQQENSALQDKVFELVRKSCPPPELCENEKQIIRDNNFIAAIKALRQRIESEYGYRLGLKESKDLCDAYKATLPKVEEPGPSINF